MAIETLYATSHITGNFTNPDNALGAPDGVWAGVVNANTNATSRWAIGDPVNPLTSGTQTIGVLLRKGSNSNNPSVVIRLFENGSLVKTLVASTSVTSTTGQTLSGTFTASEITNRDDIEVEVAVTGVGGSGTARNSAQVDSITWTADTAAAVTDHTVAATDSIGVTDAAGPVLSLTQTATDSIGVTDAATVTVIPPPILQESTDPIGAVDSNEIRRVLGWSSTAGHTGSADFVGVSDTATVAFVLPSVDLTETVSDGVGLTDTPTQAAAATVAATEAIGVTDTATRAGALSIAATDGIGITDTNISPRSLRVERVENLGLIDTAITSLLLSVTATDAIGGLDPPPTASITGAIAVTDSLGLTEDVTRSSTAQLSVLDPVGVIDATLSVHHRTLTFTDTVGVTDQSQAAVGVSIVITDGVGLIDASTTARAQNLVQVDGSSTLDAVTTAKQVAVTTTDAIGGLDSQARSFNRNIATTDPIGVLDTSALSRLQAISSTDIIGLLDSPNIVEVNGSALTESKTDLVDFTDNSQVAKTISLVVSESIGLTDTSQISKGIFTVLTEALGLLDQSFISVGRGVSVSDGAGVADSVSSIHLRNITLNDGIGVLDSADIIEVDGTAHADSFSNIFGVTDAYSSQQSFNITVTDTVGLTDTPSPTLAISVVVSDGLGISENATASIGQNITTSESIGVLDSSGLVSSLVVEASEAIGTSDTTSTYLDVGVVLTETITDIVGGSDTAAPVSARTLTLNDVVGSTDTSPVSVAHRLISSGATYNYDFETLPEADSSSWYFGSGIIGLVNDGTAHSGSNYVQSRRTSDTSLYPGTGLRNFPFEIGASYQLSVWARTPVTAPSAQVIYVRHNLRHADDSWYWNAKTQSVPNDGVWHNYTWVFTINPIGGAFGPTGGSNADRSWWIQHTGTLDDPAALLDWDNIEVTVLAESGVRENLGITNPRAASHAQQVTNVDPVGALDVQASVHDHALTFIDTVGVLDVTASQPTTALVDGVGTLDSANVSSSKYVLPSDTIGLSDTNQYIHLRTLTFADLVGLLDSADIAESDGTALADSVSNALGVTDVLVTQQNLTISIVDSVGATDTVEPGTFVPTTVTDSLGVTDSVDIELLRTLDHTFSDSVGVSDIISTAAEHNIQIADGISTADTITYVSAFNRVVTDSIQTTEAQDIADESGTAHSETFTDSIGVVEHFTASASLAISEVDQTGLVDNNETVIASIQEFVDTVGVLDTAEVAESDGTTLAEAFSNTAGLSDIVVTYQVITLVFVESISNVDSVDGKHNAELVLVNNVGLLDEALTYESTGLDQIIIDDLSLADSISTASQIARSYADQVGLSDSTFVEISSVFTDGVGIIDASAASQNKKVEPVEELGVTDSIDVVETNVFHLVFTESIALTEQLAIEEAGQASEIFSENAGISDVFTLSIQHSIDESDQIGFIDTTSINQSLLALISDSVGIDQNIHTAYELVTIETDSIGLSEQIEPAQELISILTDIFGISDSVIVFSPLFEGTGFFYLNQFARAYVGNQPVKKIYYGTQLIWLDESFG
jgi:hypothetical protein